MVKTVTKPRSVVGEVRKAYKSGYRKSLQSSTITICNNCYWRTFQNFPEFTIEGFRGYWGNL